MTLPRLEALTSYWQSYPPVHISVAGFVGIKPKPKAKKLNPEDIEFKFPTE